MMKKLIMTAMLALCSALPLSAMAASDDEVTIRVLEMHEYSKDSVMQLIALPAKVKGDDKQRGHGDESDDNMERQVREQEQKMETERIEMEHEFEGFEQAGEQFQENHQGSTPGH